MKTMNFESSLESIEKATEFINSELEAVDCPTKSQIQIDISIDEILSNIVNYAYPPKEGDFTITFSFDDGLVTLVISDSGTPYNPLKQPDPDITLSIEKRQLGGLGIYLTKKNMDELSYEFTDGQNILTLKKKI